ncbi:hypothetical protein [Mycolicibacterium fortuitum]|uniref:hypothetical protein n=1 Tax=Mycolicibacterium fortuitum TaxID=1766 RepID=UPI0026327270|nr:hypothetical protein [Mycolicibacterium fortuitum]
MVAVVAASRHVALVDIQGWAVDEYPAMGTPERLRDLLNEQFAGAGIASPWTDTSTGVRLPHGVESISFRVHGGLVRSIWITRPTGELLDVLVDCGRHTGWRVFDVDSDTEYGQ